MTLILVTVNADNIVVAADTRLSWKGKPEAKLTCKIAEYSFADACLLSAFTGIAWFGDFDTRRWLRDCWDSTSQQSQNCKDSLRSLCSEVNRTFFSNKDVQSLSKAQIRLSIVFAGRVEGKPFVALISNYEDADGNTAPQAGKQFNLYFYTPLNDTAFHFGAYGNRSGIDDDDFAELAALNVAKQPLKALKGKAHSTILKASKNARSGNSVGPDVLIASIEGDGEPTCWFSSHEGADEYLSMDAHVAGAKFFLFDVKIIADGIAPPQALSRKSGSEHEPYQD